MNLLIDTTDRKNTNIRIMEGESLLIEEKFKNSANPESVLSLIKKGLEKLQLNLSDITNIYVNPGPGSFTGVRVGIAVANALSLALQVPVNDKNVSDLEMPKY